MDAEGEALFDRFWSAYDYKTDRHTCELQFAALYRTGQLPDDLVERVRAYRLRHEERGKMAFYPKPLTFLAKRPWQDEIEPFEAPPEHALVRPSGRSAELRRSLYEEERAAGRYR